MQIAIGKFLLNQRARATTAGDISSTPINPGGLRGTPMPEWEEAVADIEIKVKFVAQKHVNMCGDACVNMLYSASGRTPPINMNKNPRGITDGLSSATILHNYTALTSWSPDWVTKDGFRIRHLNPFKLAHGLIQHGPMMFVGNYARFIGRRWSHWIVVHGIRGDQVYIADPWHGEDRHKPFKWLMDHIDRDAGELPLHIR